MMNPDTSKSSHPVDNATDQDGVNIIGGTNSAQVLAESQNATHDRSDESDGGQGSSSHLHGQDYRRDKLLLALELVQADDEDIRNVARERLITEWRKNANLDHGDRPLSQEDQRLRLKIARVLLQVGSNDVKEESKKFLMSELGSLW
jgi:hypothetical protein